MWSSWTVEPSQELDVGAMAASVTVESARCGGSKPAARWEEEWMATREHGEELPRRSRRRRRQGEGERANDCRSPSPPLLIASCSEAEEARPGGAWD